MNAFIRKGSFLPAVALFAASIHAPGAAAASLTNLGHNAGAQCMASDVNDSGIAAGACSAPNGTGPTVAWVANGSGGEFALAPLATGRSCSASGISNNGLVIGGCVDASGVGFAVTWAAPGTTVVKLLPQSGLLGLGADVSTEAAAFNDHGDIAGSSNSGAANSTAVIWKAGSTTPVTVSSPGDNCVPVDIAEPVGTANPEVVLDCPNGTGVTKAVVATPTGLLGAYLMTTLAPAPGASYCVAQSINVSLRIMGSCIFPTAPTSRVAFWQPPSTTAVALSITYNGVAVNTSGAFLNDLGNIVFEFQTVDGKSNAAYMAINAGGTVTAIDAIPVLATGRTVHATGFGASDLVVVVGHNADDHMQSAVWNPVFPAVLSPVPPFSGGGPSNALLAVSKSGNQAAGVVEDSAHVADPVVTSLP
jgi:uncharacterized membrane protein